MWDVGVSLVPLKIDGLRLFRLRVAGERLRFPLMTIRPS